MKKLNIKRILSVVLALALLLSCTVCGVANAAADGKVTYKYVVTTYLAAAYEGKLTYPKSLSVDSVTVLDETGIYSVSDDAILFNFTSDEDIDFSEGIAAITVVFNITGEYEKSDVDTKLSEFYSTDMAKGKENITYNYAHVFDDEVFLSGYADIDNPENDSIDPTAPPIDPELISAVEALKEKYSEAINTIFEGSNEYTEESIQKVWDALSSADEVLDKGYEATLEEVLAQINALQDALDALKEKESIPDDTTEPSSSSEPDESSDSSQEASSSSEPEETTNPSQDSSSSEPEETTEPTEESSSSTPEATTEPKEEPGSSSASEEPSESSQETSSSSASEETSDSQEESSSSSAPDESTEPTETTTAPNEALAEALSELSDKISEAESVISQGSLDYTLDSIQKVWNAVREAKELLNSANEVTVEEVAAQIEAIQNALDALEKREPIPENPTTQPTTSSEPDESTGPTEEPSTDSTTGTTEPTEKPTESTSPTTESKTPSTDSTTESQTSSTDSTTESTEPTESQTPPTDPTTESTGPTWIANPGIPERGDGAKVEKEILKTKSDDDPDGSIFQLLKLKNTKTTKKAIKLSYKKPGDTKKFVIYGAKCGKKYKKLKTTKATSVKIKNLKKGKYYKFLVAALDKDKKVISTSKVIHVATKGGKYGNPSKVTIKKIKKKAVTIKLGKTLKLKTKAKADKGVTVKTHRKVAFESSNPRIAKVNKKGKITAKKAGTATIYAYAQNGVTAKVKVTVKK